MAFVSAGSAVALRRQHGTRSGQHAREGVQSLRYQSVKAPKRAVLRMQEEEAQEERKPEPYPGYYKDLEASGAKAMPKRAPKVGGRKSLLNAQGVPYAPWMRFREEDLDYKPSERKQPKTDARGRLAGDPQAQELAGTGLRAKFLGDELELAWQTGDETGNTGFILSRRRGKEEEFETVADYKSDPATFKSKGPAGGSYSYLCEKPEAGTWVYRISDVDENGAVSDLSQTLVEIESEEDQKKQRIALVVFGIFVVILAAIGFLADPESGTVVVFDTFLLLPRQGCRCSFFGVSQFY
ncbi:hypothetical protein FVE85_3075 [Porphyridium purpureum]|uniref:Uncharacterized protein n=1 Tax=Porphyridium purpureum TaxID=35688 RepID=A0A5J4YVV1_PORPP|nr:hypothetical protein FVE85_3075 [Porphyridium purpureum]|eukprot:POR0450..scf227_4